MENHDLSEFRLSRFKLKPFVAALIRLCDEYHGGQACVWYSRGCVARRFALRWYGKVDWPSLWSTQASIFFYEMEQKYFFDETNNGLG